MNLKWRELSLHKFQAKTSFQFLTFRNCKSCKYIRVNDEIGDSCVVFASKYEIYYIREDINYTCCRLWEPIKRE